MAPSRKLSYQGAWGLLPLASLSVIPRYCYLFRLNESHKKMVAKAETQIGIALGVAVFYRLCLVAVISPIHIDVSMTSGPNLFQRFVTWKLPLLLQSNISKIEKTRNLFHQVINTFGQLDIVVNNVGVSVYKLTADITESDFDLVFDTNAKGTFFTLQEAAKRINDSGRIISYQVVQPNKAFPQEGCMLQVKLRSSNLALLYPKN